MTTHVAPVLTLPQARALLEAAEIRFEERAIMRAAVEPSSATRQAARDQQALSLAADALRRVLPTNEGTP